MVVEAFHGDLTDEELELVTNPENWFLRVPQQGTSSFLSALESWSRREKEGRTRTARKSFSSSKSTKRPQGFRLEKLAKSLLRPDKRQPPLCIFCLDDGSDTNDSCGKLLWCPSLPNFFAIHELCALMTPEVLTVDNPSPLGAMMFETDLKQLQSAFIRGRPLVCNVCHERGALVGCCCSKCRLVFHLPCAMRSQCYIDYEDFSNPPEERDINGTEENARSRCYYAMPRCSAKNKTCVSRIGPDKYDDSDALNDSVFNPHEALNACITCGVHSHRICAGPPWSTYTPGGDYDEEKWQCEDYSSDLDSLNDLELDVGNRMMPDDGGKCELSQIVERRVQVKLSLRFVTECIQSLFRRNELATATTPQPAVHLQGSRLYFIDGFLRSTGRDLKIDLSGGSLLKGPWEMPFCQKLNVVSQVAHAISFVGAV
ncbi:hypothetical protein Q1695_006167 [Nippostrongylus brasiliensis]|nr:hypothetical protein Q1695_006167 [Nippostrongylus brasiliensis]